MELIRDLPPRLVVVGDLNGHSQVLLKMMQALRLVGKDGAWRGGRSIVIQMGDLINRGPTGRRAMEYMLAWRDQARDAGGDVIWLLGNHEVLSVLGHEAYVSFEEYLEFAEPEEAAIFWAERNRFQLDVLEVGQERRPGLVPPIAGRLKIWEEDNVPGREAYRRAMRKDGYFGNAIRNLPIVMQFGELLFVHGGLSLGFARLGVEGLQKAVLAAWGEDPEFYDDLSPLSVLRHPLGPLWHRIYCFSNARGVRDELKETLRLMGCKKMIVGHTRTDAVDTRFLGAPLMRHGSLIMSDVGLGEPGEAGSVLVIEKGKIESFSPGGSRKMIASIKTRRGKS